MAAAIADLDHDEAHVGEMDVLGASDELLGHGLGLWAGVDVGDDRVLLRFVEVEGLVDHAVHVGDVVCRLHPVRLRELVAGVLQKRHVGRFEIHHLLAVGVHQRRRRHRVDARVAVDEVARRLAHPADVVVVALIEQGHAATVQAHLVEMPVVGILGVFHSVGGKEQHARRFVDASNAAAGELAPRQLADDRAVGAVQVVVAPTIALRPPDHLTGLEQLETLGLDIGVEMFLDDHCALAARQVGHDNVVALEIATHPAPVEAIGVGREPLGRDRFFGVRPRETPCREDVDGLVLEELGVELLPRLRRDIEHPHFGLGDVLFARHVVGVGLERRTWFGDRVDHPQFGDLPPIGACQRELARVLRPGHERRIALPGMLFLLLVGPAATITPVRVVLLTVGGQADLLDVLVDIGFLFVLAFVVVAVVLVLVLPGVLLGLLLVEPLLVLGVAHHVEVVVAREHHPLLVGRDVGPVRMLGRRLEVVEFAHLASAQVVLEVVHLLLRLARLRLLLFLRIAFGLLDLFDHLILRRDHVELNRGVVVDPAELLDRQVLLVVRVARQEGQLARHVGVVEHGVLGAGTGVDNPVCLAAGVFPRVPETIGPLEPVRPDVGIEQHLAHPRLRETGSELAVGMMHAPIGTALLWRCLLRRCLLGHGQHRKSERQNQRDAKHAGREETGAGNFHGGPLQRMDAEPGSPAPSVSRSVPQFYQQRPASATQLTHMLHAWCNST